MIFASNYRSAKYNESYSNENLYAKKTFAKPTNYSKPNNAEPINLEREVNAPICNLDMEEWLDSITNETMEADGHSIGETDTSLKSNQASTRLKTIEKSNLIDSIDVCSSLEDLVKTFDQNVKKCLSNYTDIDIGQLAPVQVRTQEELMNESQ